ncbi:MAG: DUF1669 domain-containing protein [Proteobacteria bacterium]|nr:DUF1669 domain-containing protein [Pseudomonadota bacterium]
MVKIHLSKKGSGWAVIVSSLIIGTCYVAVELYDRYYEQAVTTVPASGDIQICFTPNKKCQNLILSHIRSAQTSIYVQAYSFTDLEIGEALKDAHKRDVKVYLLLDKSNRDDHRSIARYVTGIPIRYDSLQGIAHNKIILIDEKIIITGSYNFTRKAYTKNAENVLVLFNPP